MAQEEIISQMMLPVGTMLRGTYRVDGYLASGGFGNTYVATHTEFGKRCAIKEFFMKGVSQRDEDSTTVNVSNALNQAQFDEQKEKFRVEARRLRNLRNPHIVSVSDLFDANGTTYYVMEFIDGESLSDRVKRDGPVSEQLARDILDQMLDALQTVHQQGIWHLDIKPSNIMITRDGTVKLIDFGASKQMKPSGGATTSTALCYTPGYAPCEQMEQASNEDRKKLGPWTDLYALGATLYNILTGNRPPLPVDIDDEGANAFKFGNNVSPQMQHLIQLMMDNDRHRRPQSVAALHTIMKDIHAATISNITEEPTENATITANSKSAVTTSSPKVDNQAQHSRPKVVEVETEPKGKTSPIIEICVFSLIGIMIFVFCTALYHKITIGEVKLFDFKSNEMRIAEGNYKLGNKYFNCDGAEWNYAIAANYYRKAAEKGHADAQNNLGLMYLHGEGLEKNHTEALNWLRKAAEQDCEWAQFNLGTMYQKGEGVEKNYTEAIKWYRKAAEQGLTMAQYTLGYMYENGEGVKKNKQQARYWYQKAADQGYKIAIQAIQDLNCYGE